MSKTILITGSTDGIGLRTAKTLADLGHTILLHGRSQSKLDAAAKELGGGVETYAADLSRMAEVEKLAADVTARHDQLDVLINNAGVYKVPDAKTPEGLDLRFMVNTFAPYVLTNALLSIIPADGRIVNLSSAAQAPIDVKAMAGKTKLDDFAAYAQSKLAITIWTREFAREHPNGPVAIAVNPGSLLASKMVKEGFGVAGNDIQIGADILTATATSAEFANASGKYFDNDAGRFNDPHPAALDPSHARLVMQTIDKTSSALRR
ncbi:short chain dehydrogenase [Poseidonocella pacifica]|uniref:Short chain dehydrogenase n=1 Tax=Poseidonocella pacifica TaxID=871651 RepID=A0A1I0W8R0_9RHOB|nr:SDR family NAD(P)-dependent oxidoreductase [Poseidonocella pacifica]SFA84717.1 short chain dehydrogenase [Poseidonocella pacifica]